MVKSFNFGKIVTCITFLSIMTLLNSNEAMAADNQLLSNSDLPNGYTVKDAPIDLGQFKLVQDMINGDLTTVPADCKPLAIEHYIMFRSPETKPPITVADIKIPNSPTHIQELITHEPGGHIYTLKENVIKDCSHYESILKMSSGNGSKDSGSSKTVTMSTYNENKELPAPVIPGYKTYSIFSTESILPNKEFISYRIIDLAIKDGTIISIDGGRFKDPKSPTPDVQAVQNEVNSLIVKAVDKANK